ncbi:MAG: lipoprotein BUG3 [Streptococcaceae bacterium]|nr:lipoprotein BUG3 [Streptococcaceae bacterium]
MTQMKTPFDIFLTHDFTVQSKENTKQMQINFLKKHEQEMIDFVKAQNPKVTSVQFDWNSIQTGVIGNGTPQGGGAYLLLFGYVNDNKDINFRIDFTLDRTGLPIQKSMILGQPIRIGGDFYE